MLTKLKFNVLCHTHRDPIYRYACGILGNSADAEDVTQEVLLRLWEKIAQIDITSVRAWAFTTTRNLCIDQIRRRGRHKESLLGDGELLETQSDESATDPGEAADNALVRERAERAIQDLPEVQRSIFHLHEVEGMKYRQIAKTLDLPINSVKVYLLRARRSIKEALYNNETPVEA